jgi:ParB-like chromosome segregation protein Spo0J
MKLHLLFEDHDNFLFVDDEFDEIANTPWDSGYTPQQILDHLTNGTNPELENSYDTKAIQHIIAIIKKSGGVPPNMAVTVDDDMDVIDGYHRIVAAKILGIKKIPYKL